MARDTRTRYALSFTSSSLLSREALALAPVYVELRDWGKVRAIAVAENLLQARTHSSNTRIVRETVQRLSALSDQEVEILDDLTATERGHVMWAAACRHYDLIGEFAEEVLRERFLTLAGSVSYADYDSFFRAKAMWHDELDGIADSTYKKLRAVLFRMMREATLVDSDGGIEPVLLSTRVLECFSKQTPSSIYFFPTSEVP